MINLIKKLRGIAVKADKTDADVIETAIDRIKELEDRLSDLEEDITDWQVSVKRQMSRGDEEK